MFIIVNPTKRHVTMKKRALLILLAAIFIRELIAVKRKRAQIKTTSGKGQLEYTVMAHLQMMTLCRASFLFGSQSFDATLVPRDKD